MISGVKFRAYPTNEQKLTLSQWMGCARFIWNAKCDEDKYFREFARKFTPYEKYYTTQDQKYAQFKSAELSPWLAKCPATILKNSTVNWYKTLNKFIRGKCGRPKRKAKTDKGSMHLTNDLFEFVNDAKGKKKLLIGGKKFSIGCLKFNVHTEFKEPKSIYIRKEAGKYFVSFCYKDDFQSEGIEPSDHLNWLRGMTADALKEITVGIDRGVSIPVHAGHKQYDFSKQQKNHMTSTARYIKRLQRRLARQQKGSNRRARTKQRLAKYHAKKANIRMDFAHKTSFDLVNSAGKVFVFEKLNTKKMTKKPAPKKDEHGNFIPNKAKAKAGLNKAILNVGWYQISSFVKYKAERLGKAYFTIESAYTSQECASCGHTHPDNRKTQSEFKCVSCEHVDNADHNASLVIKSRAIKLILDTGTVLEDNHLSFSGRGGVRKTVKGGKALSRRVKEASKEKCAA